MQIIRNHLRRYWRMYVWLLLPIPFASLTIPFLLVIAMLAALHGFFSDYREDILAAVGLPHYIIIVTLTFFTQAFAWMTWLTGFKIMVTIGTQTHTNGKLRWKLYFRPAAKMIMLTTVAVIFTSVAGVMAESAAGVMFGM